MMLNQVQHDEKTTPVYLNLYLSIDSTSSFSVLPLPSRQPEKVLYILNPNLITSPWIYFRVYKVVKFLIIRSWNKFSMTSPHEVLLLPL